MADSAGSKRPAEQDGDDTEAKRRKQEKMAKIKARLASKKAAAQPLASAGAETVPKPVADARAEAARKIEEIRARLQAKKEGAQAPAPAQQSRQSLDIQADIAAAKAKAAALAAKQPSPAPVAAFDTTSRLPSGGARSSHGQDGSRVRPSTSKGGLDVDIHPALRGTALGPTDDFRAQQDGARGGLSVGLHPALLENSAPRPAAGQHGPKFSTTKGNRPPEKTSTNPYLADVDVDDDPPIKVKERKSKALHFFEHGKFIAQGNAQREAAELEELKQRIAREARKTQIEEASDRAFIVARPPAVEWWDEAALPQGHAGYDVTDPVELQKLAVGDPNITDLVCHPVLLDPPQEKFAQPQKPAMLTSKEMAKKRRQDRRAEMKEQQARIRMGLVPPPPPKVKKSNMMRVLGEQAVKDPTAVEARVNREIAQRQHDHEAANAARALTKEQRQEKLKNQQANDAAKGLKIAVFRVDDLSSGKHRYQVDIGAKQNALTGVVVMNPTMYLIIVEGGEHSMKTYKKLLGRIKWTINEPPKPGSNPTTFTGSRQEDSTDPKRRANKAAEWCNPFNEDGSLKDLSANRCVLVWEGDEAELRYKKWEPRTCETDGEAKDFLKRSGMENMWTLARSK